MSLPAMLGNKRKRLDQTASSLNKPFRSPLRVDGNRSSSTFEQQTPSSRAIASSNLPALDPSDHIAAALPTSSPVHATNPVPSTPSSQSSPAKSTSPPCGTESGLPHLTLSKPFTSRGANSSKSPEYLALQSQHTRLLTELSQVKKTLDLTEQALKIESSNQDPELEAEITKWRGVAREAAEELFSVSKDKVNRMGGLAAWKEQVQKRKQAWDSEDQRQGFGYGNDAEVDEESLTDEQKDVLAQMRDEAEQERLMYGDLANDTEQGRPNAADKPAQEDENEVSVSHCLPATCHSTHG